MCTLWYYFRRSSWRTELCRAYDSATEYHWEFTFTDENKMRPAYIFFVWSNLNISVPVRCIVVVFFFAFRRNELRVFVVSAEIHCPSDSWKFIVMEIINCIILDVCTAAFCTRSISSTILLVSLVFNYLSWLYHKTHRSHCHSLFTPIYSYCTTCLTCGCGFTVTNSYIKLDAWARNLP